MPYELSQQSPAAYIPAILLSFAVTLVAYGAFPLIFARTRKKGITKKKYKWLCFGINFLIMILFFSLMNGKPSSGAPYLLWTSVFFALGINTLKKRGILDGFQHLDFTEASTYQVNQVTDSDIAPEVDVKTEAPPLPEEKPPIRFCRKCGFELIEGSKFCSRCGTEIVKE